MDEHFSFAIESPQTAGWPQNSRFILGAVAPTRKALNPDFEDATLHQLFSSADASGDGQLQLEEFIAWIFAEDQQLSFPGAPSFGFTYVISNASRAELNGEYVQQDQQYGHRPVFYCAVTGKYLFYHAPHEQWQIYAKPSTRAIARLKTQRSPQMALGANWEVRQQTGTEATYVEVSEPVGENQGGRSWKWLPRSGCQS